jgi:hypothetical protein
MMGYASGYNPVALTCHNIDEEDRNGTDTGNGPDDPTTDPTDDPLRSCHGDFDLDGDGTETAEGNLINKILVGSIGNNGALTVEDRRNLIGRWITAPEIAAGTTVMVTFPGAAYDDHPLEYTDEVEVLEEGEEVTTIDEDELKKYDPVSLLVFDEMGMSDSPMEIMLDMAVNTCTFMMADGGGTDIMCNGAMVGSMDSVSGGFRIYNSETVTYKTDVDTTTETDESEDVDNDGAEDADGDMKYMAAATLPAIGLVHSHYDVMGMDGMMGSYDHISSLLHTGEMN